MIKPSTKGHMKQFIVTIVNVMTGQAAAYVVNGEDIVALAIDSAGPHDKVFVNESDEAIQIPESHAIA